MLLWMRRFDESENSTRSFRLGWANGVKPKASRRTGEQVIGNEQCVQGKIRGKSSWTGVAKSSAIGSSGNLNKEQQLSQMKTWILQIGLNYENWCCLTMPEWSSPPPRASSNVPMKHYSPHLDNGTAVASFPKISYLLQVLWFGFSISKKSDSPSIEHPRKWAQFFPAQTYLPHFLQSRVVVGCKLASKGCSLLRSSSTVPTRPLQEREPGTPSPSSCALATLIRYVPWKFYR